MIDPDFDTDPSVCRICFSETVVDIRSQCMKRNIAFTVLLASGDLGATQTSRTKNLDSLGSGLHGSSDCLLHCSSKRNSVFERFRNTFR